MSVSKPKKVMIRFETVSNTKSKALVKHDFRIRKPDYLRSDMYHNNFDNLYFNFNSQVVNEKIYNSYDEYNSIYKEKNKRNLRDNKNSDFLSGVIITSNIVNNWLENKTISKEELEKCFIDSMPKIENKIEEILGEKLELFYYVIHYDEKTPHLHFSFNNHTKDGRAGYHTLKNSGRLSEFQDVIADVFKDVELERGERKSKVKHLSIVNMHKEEIKSLRGEIKNIQEVKKDIKKDFDKSKEEKKSELDKLDQDIRSKRNVIKDLKNGIAEKENINIKNKNKLEKKIREDTRKISSNINDIVELEKTTQEVLKEYSNSEFIFENEYAFETIDDLKNELENLEQKIESRTIIDIEEVEKLELQTNDLLNELSSDKFKLETLIFHEKKSYVQKRSMFNKKNEFDYNLYLNQSKKREKYLMSLVYQHNDFLKVLMKILRQIANFYKEAFFKKETELKYNSIEVKQNINQLIKNIIFENKYMKVSQLNVGKSSLITKQDSKYLNMHQLNLKVECNEDNKQMLLNLRSNLVKYKNIENVSFSEDKKNENTYFINVIAEYKTDLNNLLTTLEKTDFEEISRVSDYEWRDFKSKETLEEQNIRKMR